MRQAICPNNFLKVKHIAVMSSRLIPFLVAGIICFGLSFFLGAGAWYFFGLKVKGLSQTSSTSVRVSQPNSVNSNENVAAGNNSTANTEVPSPSPSASPTPDQPPRNVAPAGEIAVSGGEATLGGGNTKSPVRRIVISDFSIGETEVTNRQYQDFIEATKRRAPITWKDRKFAPGTENEPVVGVSFADANSYCEWLSKEIGATVRLPTEAEWVRAARGDTSNIYPWGNEWNDEAASSQETKGKIVAVKNFPAGRSPFGAFGMVGNVWEWTSDLALDDFGKPILFGKTKERVIKGGSAKEEKKFLNIDTHLARPEDKPYDALGFRYVIVGK